MTTKPQPLKRRLILLGSTGSIGTNALNVVEHLHRAGVMRFEIVGLATGANAVALAEQAERFDVEHVALADDSGASQLSGRVSRPRHLYTGPDAALELVEAVARPGDLVVGAMVGSAGLPATLAAIERGCDIALANKETLVAAGALVMPLVKSRGVNLLPVDSEHSAIFQCLAAGRSVDEVKRLVLTASGGPFRTWSADRVYAATVEETLNHPTWNMGPKVTVDSASLMNKALEVIEASFVEFVDGSVIAQLSPPDMKSPIQYALTWPDRAEGCSPKMDWANALHLDFEPVDHQRFPALGLAYRVVETGGSAGAVFNAANEVAVAAYLERRIPFGRISQLVGETLDAIEPAPIESLDDVHRADNAARQQVDRLIAEAPQHRHAEAIKTT